MTVLRVFTNYASPIGIKQLLGYVVFADDRAGFNLT